VLQQQCVSGCCYESSQPPVKHATSLILDRASQFMKCVATDTYADFGALRQEVHKQNAISVTKHCAHDVLS